MKWRNVELTKIGTIITKKTGTKLKFSKMSPVKVAPNPILLKENDSINQLIFDTVT